MCWFPLVACHCRGARLSSQGGSHGRARSYGRWGLLLLRLLLLEAASWQAAMLLLLPMPGQLARAAA